MTMIVFEQYLIKLNQHFSKQNIKVILLVDNAGIFCIINFEFTLEYMFENYRDFFSFFFKISVIEYREIIIETKNSVSRGCLDKREFSVLLMCYTKKDMWLNRLA